MEAKQILDYCLSSLNGTVLVESWGEKGIFYNPGLVLKRGVYVLTVKEKDGDNDKASNLDRTGIYRVNLGLRKSTFQKMYGKIPARPTAGGVVDMDCDFTALDIIIPHPVYAWMGWVSVLNPSKQTFERLKPLIQEAYEFSVEKFQKENRQKLAVILHGMTAFSCPVYAVKGGLCPAAFSASSTFIILSVAVAVVSCLK